MRGLTRATGLIVFSLILGNSLTMAEVYQWTDEQGKTHFGDKVPEQYKAKSEAVELQPSNTVPLKQSNDASRSTMREAERRNQSSAAAPASPSAKKLDSCEQQQKAYDEAAACYRQCRLLGSGNNIANCGHCSNVPKPDC